jgi:hypothetical protein
MPDKLLRYGRSGRYSEHVHPGPVDFSSLADHLAEIDAWLKSQGIATRGRMQLYARNISEMKRLHTASVDAKAIYEATEQAGKLTEVLSSYVEAFEFADTLNVLRAKNIRIPEETLKKVLGGSPDAAIEDADSNGPRNFMFELVMGAVLAKAGFTPHLQTEPDITLEFEDKQILVACKRVLSEARIAERIGDAAKQIRKHTNSENQIGLIAISVTRLIYTGKQVWEVDSVDDVHPFMEQKVTEIIRHQEHTMESLDGSNILGVIFHLSTPVHVMNKGFTPASYRMMFPVESNNPHLLARFGRQFSN